MYEVPLKFLLAWFIIISITYATVGYLYYTSYETNIPDVPQDAPNKGIFDQIIDGIGWLFDIAFGIFKVCFFLLPEIPAEVVVFINLVIQPFNLIFLLGIYPIVSDVIQKIIDFISAIIPL